MITRYGICLSLCLALHFGTAGLTWGQSTLIEVPSSSIGLPANVPARLTEFPPSTLTQRQRAWEAILRQVQPTIAAETMKAGQLIDQLRKLGLPLQLHQSAIDDSLPHDETVQLELPDQPLILRLDNTLRKHNSAIAMIGERLAIISMDVSNDPENFLILSYDISSIGFSIEQLNNVIKGTIDPDGWDDTNGDATLSFQITSRYRLLTLGAPYSTHLKFRRMMEGFRRLAGVSIPQNSSLGGSRHALGSQTIPTLEQTNASKSRQRSRRSRTMSFNKGGGVF